MRLLVAAVALSLCVGGCDRRKEKTPEQAFLALEKAIAAGDARAFYRLLDDKTQELTKKMYEAERVHRDIVRTRFPEAQAGPELARLEAAAQPSVEDYFVALNKERKLVERYRKRLGSVSGNVATKPAGSDQIWVARQDGMPFRFGKVGAAWAFVEMAEEMRLEAERAQKAVATVRENAAIYRTAENRKAEGGPSQ
jgi:hypothetical protein